MASSAVPGEEVPAISVVVVSYHSGRCLRECVTRVLASTGVTVEVIVVDNASTDDSVAVAQALADAEPRVTVISNPDNRGFAVACNQGAGSARYPCLLFLNPDCFVAPDTLALTSEALRQTPAAAAAGALVLNPDGRPQRGCRRRIPDPVRAFYRVSGLSRLGLARFADFNQEQQALPERAQAVEAISGSYLMIRREDFRQMGGWDEGYFLHCEDLDLCQRLAERGRSILFVPEARAMHLQGESSRRTPLKVEWYKHRGMWRFYRKFQARRYGALISGLVQVGITAHFLGRAVRALWPGSAR